MPARRDPRGAVQPVERRLRIREEASTIAIEVADDGPGIPMEDMQRIFGEFYRSAGTAAEASGTGLGLSISHGIVEEHGGTLRVESRPGHGSIFTLELPKSPIQRDVE